MRRTEEIPVQLLRVNLRTVRVGEQHDRFYRRPAPNAPSRMPNVCLSRPPAAAAANAGPVAGVSLSILRNVKGFAVRVAQPR
jgi:hypothetical protein